MSIIRAGVGLLSASTRLRVGRVAYYTLALLLLVGVAYLGYWLRMLPIDNYESVRRLAVSFGISDRYARLSYLTANDPWIEYWLANYLHEHGVGSWTSLTRSNPDTGIFWYPWGRRFTGSEYPLIPMLGSLGSDPLETTIRLPVYGGVAMIVVVYVLLLLEYGLVSALLAGLALAVVPAATSRTFAGFVEKEGFAMHLLAASILLLSYSLKRYSGGWRALLLAVLSGIVGGVITIAWGGYAVAGLVYASTALFIPLTSRNSRDARRKLYLVLAAAATYAVLGYAFNFTGYGAAHNRVLVLAPAATIYVVAIMLLFESKAIARAVNLEAYGLKRVYALVFLATIAAGLAAAPRLGISGRYFAAMVWPLKEAGYIHLGRLGETVAEQASILRTPHGLRNFLADTGYTIGVLIPLVSAYMLYRAIRHGEAWQLPLALPSIGLYYGAMGMLYLSQSASTIGSIAVAATVGSLASMIASERGETRRKRKRAWEMAGVRELRILTIIVLVLLVLAGTAVGYQKSHRTLTAHVSTATGLGKNFVNLGWIQLLQDLGEEVPKSIPVVAWWDYGYWISVGSGHPSLADGATSNGTQIRLLAEMFTGDEDEADRILRSLHLKPNRTLILVHDMALYDERQHALIYLYSLSTDDIKKAWAMHHIAERDLNYELFMAALARGRQDVLDRVVNGTFIFKLFADAPYHSDKAKIAPKASAKLVDYKVNKVLIAFSQRSRPLLLKKQAMRHFEPYAIIVAPYMNFDGKMIEPAPKLYYVRLIIIYKWIG